MVISAIIEALTSGKGSTKQGDINSNCGAIKHLGECILH